MYRAGKRHTFKLSSVSTVSVDRREFLIQVVTIILRTVFWSFRCCFVGHSRTRSCVPTLHFVSEVLSKENYSIWRLFCQHCSRYANQHDNVMNEMHAPVCMYLCFLVIISNLSLVLFQYPKTLALYAALRLALQQLKYSLSLCFQVSSKTSDVSP